MPDVIGTAFIAIRPAVTGFASQAQGQLGAEGKKMGKRFGGMFAAGAGVVVGFFLKSAFSEAEQAQKIGKQTAAVIKSTGGAAQVSAPQVESLATQLSKMAGIDDEVIQAGENMLLTFKNIRNERGKGNKIFDQATKATLDLAVGYAKASGTTVDLQGSSVMLGKALNDPILGITALTRRGVQFTQQQKDQVKALVESGDTLGAQKIILKEVTEQFGGSAAAQATASGKMKVAFDNLKESIGTALLPVIQKLSEVLVPLFTFISEHQPVLYALAVVVGGVLTAAFYSWAASLFVAGGALAFLVSPITAVVLGLAALGVAVYLLWTNWDQVWTWIKDHPAIWFILGLLARPVASFITIIGALHELYEAWARNWDSIKQNLANAWAFIESIVRKIRNAWDGMFDGIARAWGGVAGVVSGIIDKLRTIANLAKSAAEKAGGIGGGIVDFVNPFAAGGPVGPGLALVGEKGPELLHMAGHGRIDSAQATAGKLGGRGGLVIQNATFGDRNVIADLDYWTMTRLSGV